MPRCLRPRCLRLLCLLVGLLFSGMAIAQEGKDDAPDPKTADKPALEHIELQLAPNVAMKLVKVPAGKFLMGNTPGRRTRVPDDREDPQHEVTISRDFHMGVCEVTRGQFAAFVAETGYLTQAEREGWTFAWNGHIWTKVVDASWKNVGLKQTDEHPVLCVSFDDAIAFCDWLSKKTGRKVLLPTEAQFEYAARAGSTADFPWGDKREDGKGWANAADETARQKYRGWITFRWPDDHIFTAPVGTYRANAFGLHDMIGNVWEWTADWYDKDYYKKGPNVDPLGPETGTQRVTRGGSWMSSPNRCRAAGRLPSDLRGSYCDVIVGFRVVIDDNPARKLPSYSIPCRPDWPDWRGPRRDGVSRHVPTSLPEKAQFLWTRKTTGPGHSGVSVADDRVLFADKSADNKNDIWRCLDAANGKELWTLEYAAEGQMPYTNSPRAAPVIHDGRAYLLGPFGHLHCVKAVTGEVLWKKHLIDDFGGQLPTWGMTATPLLVDDKLIVNPGAKDASLVALDRKTGEIVWKSPGAAAAYASPIYNNCRGHRQVIAYDAETLGGWDVGTGKRVWTITPERKHDYNVPTPIALLDQILVATENNSTRLYGFAGRGDQGSVRANPRPKFRFDDLAPDMVTPVAYNGLIFGPHNASLYCLDARTLQLVWEQRDIAFESYTSLIAGNGRVLITTVDGELILIAADRKGYKQIGRLRLFEEPRTQLWSHPALTKGRLYIRNEKSINCLALP